MAMIDYGAILKINGKFINKNQDLFMDMKEVGFTLEKAKYLQGEDILINDDFFVYAGTKDFLLCFYKTYFCVVDNGIVIGEYIGDDLEETILFIKDTSIKVKHLNSPNKYKTNRYITSWEHNGNNYEVIFGNGIDPNEDVWDEIKFNSYNFTNKERKIIDEWFM